MVRGELSPHRGTGAITVDFKRSAQLRKPFAHSGKTDAPGMPGSIAHQDLPRHSLAVVCNRHSDAVVRSSYADPDRTCLGMTVDIRQRLLQYAEKRQLRLSRQALGNRF